MLLYRNRPSVVIGRNQNPWLEADLGYLSQKGIELVRRYSGGGAVYHDLGNTNYSYMMTRDKFDRDTTAQTIVDGLGSAGLEVKLNERHDITVKVAEDYKKCSGSAYKISKDRAYAHGTMLLSSDLGNLGPALRPPPSGIVGNGVDSVRSKVANLNLTHENFCEIVARAFHSKCQQVSEAEIMSISEVIESREQLIGRQWKYNQTPVFTQTITTSSDTIVATIRQGRYASFTCPESMNSKFQQLVGKDFELGQLAALANTIT